MIFNNTVDNITLNSTPLKTLNLKNEKTAAWIKNNFVGLSYNKYAYVLIYMNGIIQNHNTNHTHL